MSGTISISGVVTCHACPVRYYLGRTTGGGESPRYTLAKQIAYHLGGELDAARIWQEVQLVHPGIDPAMEQEARDWVARCAASRWQKAEETDVRVASRRLGIHGVVDRLFDDDPWFAIVRSSEAPSAGIYASDRIRVACSIACLEETLGVEVAGGMVDYIPSGTSRFCIPQPRDRRAALRALKEARRVEAGEVPKKPKRGPCEHCHQKERCFAADTGRRLADLLSPRREGEVK